MQLEFLSHQKQTLIVDYAPAKTAMVFGQIYQISKVQGLDCVFFLVSF